MATQQYNFDRLALLKQAGIPTGYFARYSGIHRVTVSMWANGRTPTARPVYWAVASKLLDLVEKGLNTGVFPIKKGKRNGYEAFAAAMTHLAS